MTWSRVLPLVLAGLILAGAAGAPVAAANPAQNTVNLVGALVLCSIWGADGLIANAVGPFFSEDGDYYPGRDLLHDAIGVMGEDGTLGGPVNAIGGTLGATWDATYPLALRTISEAESSAANAVKDAPSGAGGSFEDGRETVRLVKCTVWGAYMENVNPYWSALVTPVADCFVPPGPDAPDGGPGWQWIFSDVLPESGGRPLPSGRFPPCAT